MLNVDNWHERGGTRTLLKRGKEPQLVPRLGNWRRKPGPGDAGGARSETAGNNIGNIGVDDGKRDD